MHQVIQGMLSLLKKYCGAQTKELFLILEIPSKNWRISLTANLSGAFILSELEPSDSSHSSYRAQDSQQVFRAEPLPVNLCSFDCSMRERFSHQGTRNFES